MSGNEKTAGRDGDSVDNLPMSHHEINQSHDEVRLQPSPLELSPESKNQTQVLKLNINNDGSVIHEVEEENEPATNRHSMLRKEAASLEN